MVDVPCFDVALHSLDSVQVFIPRQRARQRRGSRDRHGDGLMVPGVTEERSNLAQPRVDGRSLDPATARPIHRDGEPRPGIMVKHRGGIEETKPHPRRRTCLGRTRRDPLRDGPNLVPDIPDPAPNERDRAGLRRDRGNRAGFLFQ